MVKRRATHAGSWYTSDASKLDAQLSQWLAAVKSDQFPSPVEVASQTPSTTDPLGWPISDARAVISPHAGYSYSGPPAAYSYGAIPADKKHIKRIFILGPSHHYYLPGCALSKCSAYETPLGDLPLDRELIESLYDQGKSSGDWEWMERDTDEDEHSIEMQLPYLRKIFQGQDVSLVPILVGALNVSSEIHYGKLLSPYLSDPSNFFVISSDFCHWGSRFSYTYYRSNPTSQATQLNSRVTPSVETPIHQSIRELDDEGMQAISFPRASSNQPDNNKTAKEARDTFSTYLKKTKNTICGRHPIGVLLAALAELEEKKGIKAECRFVRYEQSSGCETVRDSSVSYAAGFVRF